MLALKVVEIGDSLGIALPSEAIGRLGIGKGDVVFLIEAADGYRITPGHDSAVQMDTARS